MTDKEKLTALFHMLVDSRNALGYKCFQDMIDVIKDRLSKKEIEESHEVVFDD